MKTKTAIKVGIGFALLAITTGAAIAAGLDPLAAHHALVAWLSDPVNAGGLVLAEGVAAIDGEKVMAELKRIAAEFGMTQAQLAARIVELEQKGARPGGAGGSGNGQVSIGDRIADAVLASTQLEELRSGSLKTARIPIGSFRTGPKAAVTLTNTGMMPMPQRDPEIFGPIPRRVSVGDLIPHRPTSAGSIQYLQATRTGLAAQQVLEGDVKPQLDLAVTLLTAPVVTVAAWTAVSRQALDDTSQLRDFITSTLIDALEIGEDNEILNGTGAAGHMGGLLTVATAYSRGATTPTDVLRGAITQIALAGGICDGIVLSPIGLEMLELEKDTQGRYILTLTVDTAGASRVWRVPVVSTLAMVGNAFLCADFGRATRIWDREQATIVVSLEHSDYFVRNLAAVLAESREALTVPRPALLVKGAFV